MFLKLVIHNFFAVEHAEIPLKDLGLVLIEGNNTTSFGCDSNGAGKSTLFEAMLWVLYDRTQRGQGKGSKSSYTKDDVIRSGSHDGCYVELYLEIDGKEACIRRARKHSEYGTGFYYLSTDGGLQDLLGTLPEAEFIRRYVGLDYSGFLYTMVMGQNSKMLLTEAPDSDQKSLYESILITEDLGSIKSSVTASKGEVSGKSREASIGLSATEGEKHYVTSSLTEAKVNQSNWELARQSSLNELRTQITDIELNISSNREELNKSEVDIKTVCDVRNEVQATLRSWENKKAGVERAKIQRKDKEDTKTQLDERNQQLTDFESRRSGCVITKQDLDSKLSVIVSDKNRLFQELEDKKLEARQHTAFVPRLDLSPVDIELAKAEVDRNNWEEAIGKVRQDLANADQLVDGAQCGVCSSKITSSTRKRHEEYLQTQLKELTHKLQGNENERTRLLGVRAGLLEDHQKAETLYLEKLELYKSEIRSFETRHNTKVLEFQVISSRVMEVEKEVSSLEAQIAGQKVVIAHTATRLASIPDVVVEDTDITGIELNIVKTIAEISVCDSEIQSATAIRDSIREQLTKSLQLLSARNSELKCKEVEVNPYSITDLESRLQVLSSTQLKQQQELEEHEKRFTHLELLETIFGDKGIKSYLFDYVVGPLNERASYYSQMLTNGELGVEFTTTKKLKNGETRENFSINVSHSKGSSKYMGMSGGQQKRANILVLKAAREILRDSGKLKINFSGYDEFTTDLDSAGKEMAFRLIELEAQELGTVFVVTHDPQWKSRFLENGRKIITATMGDDCITRFSFNWS